MIDSPAKRLAPGMRLPDIQMINQADGVPISLYHRFTMTGHFRLLVFAGNISNHLARQRLLRFGEWLKDSHQLNTGLETIVLHSSKRAEVELMELPEIFRPWTDTDGWDYWRVYADDESYHDGHGLAYQRCGIDRDDGCVVIMRPDGYASLICRIEQTCQISAFFRDLGLTSSTETVRSARL